jgi:hypothetical protein
MGTFKGEPALSMSSDRETLINFGFPEYKA